MSRKSLYSVHPSLAMVQKWKTELPQKTGRSLEQWIAFIKKHGPETEKARRDWLKTEQQFGTNTAWWLAARSCGKDAEDDSPEAYLQTAQKYVEEMFARKPQLQSLYDAALRLGLSLGKDVKVCPCKTMVPFYRNNVFAKLTPSTRSRLDLGLCLRGIPFSKRLTDTGGTAKKDRITHNIAITTEDDFDAELKKWFKKAYEMDA